uniref:glutaminase n=1 Tax=Macrostomum lignano TaxID=282301 RepID=A0A1I8JCG1_9PLAT
NPKSKHLSRVFGERGAMPQLKIGLLAIQGAFIEHRNLLESAVEQLQQEQRQKKQNSKDCYSVEAIEVRRGDQLTEDLDALIIPGGESTTVAKFMQQNGLLDAYKVWFSGKAVVWGICAGLIALSDRVVDMKTGGLAVTTDRNFYGRQRESFECQIELKPVEDISDCNEYFPGVFIRAPKILSIDKPESVRVLATVNSYPVAVAQDRILACSFHPELTEDPRLHLVLLKMVLRSRGEL